jgi:hypothetical protein
LAEYARPPTWRIPNSSPAFTIASRTASPSAYGPNTSKPGCPAIPCRSVRTGLPAMVMWPMLKNLSSGGFVPRSFSITFIAFGPWIWKRYDLRLNGSGRAAERSSSSTFTS